MFKSLEPFLPAGALPLVEAMLAGENFHLVVTRPRTTKYGDFRPPKPGETPRLTVNGNLNRYAFLITLVHEVAHLKVWNSHRGKVNPHGKEWKLAYAELLKVFTGKGIFAPELEPVILAHIKKPGYSSGTDHGLTLALRTFDRKIGERMLQEINPGSVFVLGKKTFKMGEKLRKHYLCTDVQTGRQYRVHALAIVQPVALPDLR
jgi:hypothetical protein